MTTEQLAKGNNLTEKLNKLVSIRIFIEKMLSFSDGRIELCYTNPSSGHERLEIGDTGLVNEIINSVDGLIMNKCATLEKVFEDL